MQIQIIITNLGLYCIIRAHASRPMSTSYNVDEGKLLSYICFCFDAWGIHYVTKQVLKKARDNSSDIATTLTKLVFDLSLLQCLDFQYTLDELGVAVEAEDEFVQEFVLAYLSEAGCPFLIESGEAGVMQGFDFREARVLLLVSAWVMAKNQFFGKLRTHRIEKMYTRLYIDKISTKGAKAKPASTYYNTNNGINKPSYSSLQPKVESIQRLFKAVSLKHYQIECLHQKHEKILHRLSNQLTKYNKVHQTNITVDALLREPRLSTGLQADEQELQALIDMAMGGLVHQQHFWKWLQYKVMEPEYKRLEAEHGDQFERIDDRQQVDFTRMNSQYLQSYVRKYKQVEQTLGSLNQMYEASQCFRYSKIPKEQAMIKKEVTYEFNRIINEVNPVMVKQLGKPCFLKLEVAKYCQKKGFSTKNKPKTAKNAKLSPRSSDPTPIKAQMRNLVHQFISSLQQLRFL